jgi:hypothetical protein
VRKIPLLLFLRLILLPTVLSADEVFLKGAGSISGRIVEQTDTMVTVDLGSGVMGVPMAHVERIVRARGPLDEYQERAARLAPVDMEGWQELGRWAAHQGLSTQSRQAYERALEIAPNDPETREALGFVLLDGLWVTEEEGYRARGFVRYAGEWMMPAEAQMLIDAAAAEQERRDAAQTAREAGSAKLLEDLRAEYAAEKAVEDQAWEEDRARWHQFLFWGGWGYGLTSWPLPSFFYQGPYERPSHHHAQGRR